MNIIHIFTLASSSNVKSGRKGFIYVFHDIEHIMGLSSTITFFWNRFQRNAYMGWQLFGILQKWNKYNTKIDESHPTFCRCEGKTRPDIILQVMKYEPKITWNTKRNKSNELSLAKLHPRNDIWNIISRM
jgi:hypothetical protein